MTLSVDERRIAEIVQRVVADLRPEDRPGTPPVPPSPTQRPATAEPAAPVSDSQPGVFSDIDGAIAAAEMAQKRLGENISFPSSFASGR